MRGRGAGRGGLLALAALLATGAHAQVAQITVQDARGRPTTTVRVGDPLRVVVTVRPPAGAYPLFPAPPPGLPDSTALRFGDAHVQALDRRPPRLEGDARTDTAVYTAAVFTLDSARVGPVEVRLVAGADTAVVQAAAVFLEVAATTPDSARLQPPGPPLGFPRAWGPWALALAATTLAAGLLALAVRVWRRRPRRSRMPAMGHLPPYEQALARLDALARAPVDSGAAVEAHHVELADVLRTYLARTLRLDAHRLTTSDLDRALDGDPLVPEAARAALVGVLRETDLVKFARRRPTPHALANARARARAALDAIEEARRPPPEATTDGGPATARVDTPAQPASS